MSGFQDMFADILMEGKAMPPAKIAQEIARYHHYRKHNGMAHDTEILDALRRRNYISGGTLREEDLLQYPKQDRMTCQLIGAVMECLQDGREFHSAMMCGLTACASRM